MNVLWGAVAAAIVSSGLAGPVVAQVQGQWAATGFMSTPREYGALLALPNGNALAVGGYDANSNVLSSAEIYNAKKGVWTPAGSLGTARANFAAVTLPTGRVLVTGGTAAGNVPLATAELFNPKTNSWSGAGTMATARLAHTATLLPDGRVLVAGGCTVGDCSAVTGTSEIYDPTTNAWSGAGSLSVARGFHSAVLLSSGKVMAVAGYVPGTGASAAVDLFDPATGIWSAAASLAVARWQHGISVLADGKVLVSGGVQTKYPMSNAELYDPMANSWTMTGAMASGRYAHGSVALPDGTVLVAGGVGQAISCGKACVGYIPFAAAEIYNEASNAFAATAPLNRALAYEMTALTSPGRALIAGGQGLTSICCVVVPDAQLYTPLSLVISSYSLNFGFLQIGLSTAPQSVTVTNASDHAVNFGAIAASGDYSQTNTCPATLPSGQSCSVHVQFTPTATGVRKGAVTLTDDSPGSPKQVIALSGTGETLALAFSPASLNFGGVTPGSSAVLGATLINDGAAPVAIGAVSILPMNKTYTQTNDCPATLAVQQSCAFQLSFMPPDVGKYTATLTVSNGAGAAPPLALKGTGLNN